jgi:hypothetical protein
MVRLARLQLLLCPVDITQTGATSKRFNISNPIRSWQPQRNPISLRKVLLNDD